MKSTEAQLESAIIELLGVEGYPHVLGEAIERQPQEVLTTLRNSLLQKLISGKLRIPEAEQLIEKALT
jgi:type I restriction enzyme R subunit